MIAHVDGFALGGGFEMMLACHVVVASERSQFGLPEARIGCMPGLRRHPAAIRFGRQARRDAPACSAASASTPHRAWQLGLLSVPPLAPEADVDGGRSPGAADRLRQPDRDREHPRAARSAVAPAALDHEAALAALSIASPDGQEGITSFAERRAPVFHEEL